MCCCASIYPGFAHVLNTSAVLLPVKKDMVDIKELEKNQRKTVIKDVLQLPLEITV